MADLRAELQRKATGAFLQYALLRIESALVIAGTILAAVFLPALLPEVPWWGWLLIGGIGWGAIVVSSITDPDTSAKVLWQLLRERLQVGAIKNRTLRDRAETMVAYVRPVESDLYKLKGSTIQPVLEDAAEQLYGWIEQGTLFARYADTFQRDHRLEKRRQELPSKIETLAARLKYEKNPDIIQRLNAEVEALGRDWQSLQLLEAQMQQAESQLGQTLTALARATGEMHVISTEESIGQDQVAHLQQEIQRHQGQMTDLASQIEQLYTAALDKG